MKARRYAVTLKGETPILMHADNVEWTDYLGVWKKDPANKGKSVPGDDRTPPFTWIGYLYHENGKVVIPSDNLMTVLREGGAKVLTGKGQKTFKAQSQSGIVVDQSGWGLIVDGNEISYRKLKGLIGEPDFNAHKQVAVDMGFELFVKRASVGTSKHVRVRPRFDKWECSGTITVLDDAITTSVLRDILTFAGVYCGMCDWRPSSKTPGSFGKFTAEIAEVK